MTRGDWSGAAGRFEEIYRAHVRAVTAYFARRSGDPQTVADLTAETFVEAIVSFATFDPARGKPGPWLFGIAAHVYAKHCDQAARGQDTVRRVAGHRLLDPDETAELDARIDAERAGRALLERLAGLPERDRRVVELVDLAGLTPKEAAAAMNVSPGALRIRLFRARAKLRNKEEPERDRDE